MKILNKPTINNVVVDLVATSCDYKIYMSEDNTKLYIANNDETQHIEHIININATGNFEVKVVKV